MNGLPDFEDFFVAVHTSPDADPVTPFPWQARLATEVTATGRWPVMIDVPTGLGKTAVLDVAVWVAAASGVGADRPGRRRMFFVIDRRVVVDEAFEHAQIISARLRDPSTSSRPDVMAAIAAALRANRVSPVDGELLSATRMRGGVTWDWNWLDRPDRLAIVVGTVDQLGSRLFFRGYGLRHTLTPIDAALVGTDSLVVVDEAHLAAPLQRALETAQRLDEPAVALGVSQASLVVMSATQRRATAAAFSTTQDDRAHPVAGARLRADKRLHLVTVPPRGRVEDVMAHLALDQAARSLDVVGVVCNTVRRARDVHQQVDEAGVESVLLTGRVRPLDRDRNIGQFKPRFAANRLLSSAPLVVVATQTIEVGVNADFDSLITESAPWSSLVQRFGRLNRIARRDDSVIALAVSDGMPSLVYGDVAIRTFEWLASRGAPTAGIGDRVLELNGPGLLVSSEAIAELTDVARNEGSLESLELTAVAAPALGRAQLDAWTRTAPVPATDPPLDPYLHGFSEPDAEVRLVWRADLLQSVVADDRSMIDAVERLPPLAGEALEVPLRAAVAWLRRLRVDEPVSDDAVPMVTASRESKQPVAERWSGLRLPTAGEAEVLVFPADAWRVRPGDTVVLPAAVGGCDRWGWEPRSLEAVSDLGDVAVASISDAFSLRLLGPSLRAVHEFFGVAPLSWPGGGGELDGSESGIASADGDPAKAWESYAVGRLVEDEADALLAELPRLLASFGWEAASITRVPRLIEVPVRHVIVGLRRQSGRSIVSGADEGPVVADALASSRSLGAVPLTQHLDAVASRARDIVDRLGVPSAVANDVVLAAAWHDVGKLDLRFQRSLRGGGDDPFAVFGEPLAKSGMDPTDRAVFRQAHRVSGLPPGFRHEVGSAQAALQRGAELGVADMDLFVHLVAAHHGHGRPLFPPVADDSHEVSVDWAGSPLVLHPARSIDWDQPARFARLNERYGRWGLALLETIVRLADIECSKEGT